MLYADARGVRRIYRMRFEDGHREMWGQAGPGSHQRFEATIRGDGRLVTGRWDASSDGEAWKPDFEVTYAKRCGGFAGRIVQRYRQATPDPWESAGEVRTAGLITVGAPPTAARPTSCPKGAPPRGRACLTSWSQAAEATRCRSADRWGGSAVRWGGELSR